MAKVHDDNICGKDVQRDTDIHCNIRDVVDNLDGNCDIAIIPGDGVYVHKDACRRMSKHDHNDRYPIRIGEDEILELAAKIKTVRELRNYAKTREEEHAAICHDGTDAVDPDKSGNIAHGRDMYRPDHSKSTISILTVSSNGTYLNGSATKHHEYVSIAITAPDGRALVTADNQLTSALVSSRAVPCTVSRFWSINNDNIQMSEIVKQPDSVEDRMRKRIGDRLESHGKTVDKLIGILDEQIDSGRPMSKTKLSEIRRELSFYKDTVQNSVAFTTEQASEEISSVVEQAAIYISAIYGNKSEDIKRVLPRPSDDV